ncbi:hypothetical protein COCNU_scaffold030058G000010 [Cocos nucifera]|nr:hypothetical protein [Cocos nucifera]
MVGKASRRYDERDLKPVNRHRPHFLIPKIDIRTPKGKTLNLRNQAPDVAMESSLGERGRRTDAMRAAAIASDGINL